MKLSAVSSSGFPCHDLLHNLLDNDYGRVGCFGVPACVITVWFCPKVVVAKYSKVDLFL
jgi:hypothetical protein